MLFAHHVHATCCQAAHSHAVTRLRFSPELLNLRRIEQALAEQKDFKKAVVVRRCCSGVGFFVWVMLSGGKMWCEKREATVQLGGGIGSLLCFLQCPTLQHHVMSSMVQWS